MRAALARLLRARGYAVKGLPDLAALDTALPLPAQSCLLVDIVLGRENGLDVPAHLAARNQMAPIVFMSATDDEEKLASADTAGAVRCLRKPFEAASLFAALDSALGAAAVPIPELDHQGRSFQ